MINRQKTYFLLANISLISAIVIALLCRLIDQITLPVQNIQFLAEMVTILWSIEFGLILFAEIKLLIDCLKKLYPNFHFNFVYREELHIGKIHLLHFYRTTYSFTVMRC